MSFLRANWLGAVVVGLCACASAVGQGGPPEGPVFLYQTAPAPPPGPGMMAGPGAHNVMFFRAEMADSGKPVTGVPYSATAVSERNQTLADGNRIHNKTTASVARDAQGRTRREEVMGKIGPWAVNGPHLVFIHDPVSHTDTILDSNDHTAHVLKPGKPGSVPGHFQKTYAGKEVDKDSAEVRTESLGTQTIAGVSAEGKRVTRTIPAGEIGNDRPLETTSEVWYSPELQVVVMSKHSDPRFGETTYQLTDVRRAEPDHSLFEVPGGYTLKQGPPAPPPLPR
jgi:hypothetical protein